MIRPPGALAHHRFRVLSQGLHHRVEMTYEQQCHGEVQVDRRTKPGYHTCMQSERPARFVLPRKPAAYPKQGVSHCGAFSVKAILSAYGKDTRTDPRQYHLNWFGRITGSTLSRSYWARALSTWGLSAHVANAGTLSREDRVQFLKQLLLHGSPVMLLIGNGYLPSGRYMPLLGKMISHWITLWGYDDSKGVFYVYDSCVPQQRHDQDVPVGNARRTYTEVLRDWESPAFLFPGWRYTYITLGT